FHAGSDAHERRRHHDGRSFRSRVGRRRGDRLEREAPPPRPPCLAADLSVPTPKPFHRSAQARPSGAAGASNFLPDANTRGAARIRPTSSFQPETSTYV